MLPLFPFKAEYPTPAEHTKGTNTKEYIVLHHTATWEGTIKGVLDGLYRREDYASVHFCVDTNGDTYKLGDPDDILWHAGKSAWEGKTDLNRYSIGIEIIGPLADGGFTDAERLAVRKLVQHLMSAYNIPKENVIRHKDIAPGRKPDVADTFWGTGYRTYKDYQDTLTPVLYVSDEDNAVKAEIWNGKDGDRVPTRKEAATMFTRASGKNEADIWSAINPNGPISSFEVNTMSTRAFGRSCGAMTRRSLAAFCYRNRTKK